MSEEEYPKSHSINPYSCSNNKPHFNNAIRSLPKHGPNMQPKAFCHGPQQGFVQAHGPHLIAPHQGNPPHQ